MIVPSLSRRLVGHDEINDTSKNEKQIPETSFGEQKHEIPTQHEGKVMLKPIKINVEGGSRHESFST